MTELKIIIRYQNNMPSLSFILVIMTLYVLICKMIHNSCQNMWDHMIEYFDLHASLPTHKAHSPCYFLKAQNNRHCVLLNKFGLLSSEPKAALEQ